MYNKLTEQQQRYDEVWEKGLVAGKEQRGNFETNISFIEKLDLLKPDCKILEIGCGIGSIVNYLTLKGFDVVGTDISSKAINYGRKKYPETTLEVVPAEHLPYSNNAFEVVLSFDLFEHIADTEQHIKEVKRVLKPGGYYLFQTPNKYFNAIYETLKHKSSCWKQAHPSLHSPGELKRRLGTFGFSCDFVKINPVNAYNLDKLDKFNRFAAFVFKHIKFEKLPVALQTNLYVVGQNNNVGNS